MIIWLASYPKSGNTWVRIFINSLIYKNGDESDINNLKIGQFPNRSHFKELTEKIYKSFSENKIEESQKLGSIAFFGEKYGDQVRVLKIAFTASSIKQKSHICCPLVTAKLRSSKQYSIS